jgi:alpha-galactosidase
VRNRVNIERCFLFFVAFVASLISVGPVFGTTTWSVEADFSISANPNGVWSYGYSTNIVPGYGLVLFDTAVTAESGLQVWSKQGTDPCITHNPLNTALGTGGQNWPPHTAAFHPGPSGEYSMYRWVAQSTGLYDISAIFSVGHTGQGCSTSTDVHIIQNGSTQRSIELYACLIDATQNGNDDTSSYSATVLVNKGDTIDFAVGYGSNGVYYCDTTLINATITKVSDGPLLWLKADEGIVSDQTGVITWQDQSVYTINANRQFGAPQHVTVGRPEGDYQVIRFDGNDGFFLSDWTALQTPSLTIYAVGAVENNSQNQTFIANYADVYGYDLGISDAKPNTIKWFTAQAAATMESTRVLFPGELYLITAIFDSNSGQKNLYINSKQQASGTANLSYTNPTYASVGVLDSGRQFLTGDIAEIIVFNSVDANQRETNEEYLRKKYTLAASCGDAGTVYLAEDLNRDCHIDLKDLGILAASWLQSDWLRLDALAESWLKCTDIQQTACYEHIERTLADTWLEKHITGPSPEPPFSFVYNGVSSKDILGSWNFERTSRGLDSNRTEWTLKYSSQASGLEVNCVVVTYNDFPTVEWTVYFKNTTGVESAIIENIYSLDDSFERASDNEFVLHHQTGGLYAANAYQPYDTIMSTGSSITLQGLNGRPTDSHMPYYNLEWDKGGAIVVVGWPGQWSSKLTRNLDKNIHITAGQELTHFKLSPGERVRSPLMAMQFYAGDRIRAQNIWRKFMLAHNLPRPGNGQIKPMMAACTSGIYAEMCSADQWNQNYFIDRYVEEQIPIDFWHMDAGWYISSNCWVGTGTWEVDPVRFPGGLRAVTDHAHSYGIDSIVWFEPERVTSGTWITNNHPEWVLGGSGGGLLNLGNTQAWDWLINHIDGMLISQGIDLYRQDFNIEPLGYWRGNDTSDRSGMTELKYIMGYLAYWDELRRRHPDMLIDSCASGGRRNDLETLRRSVPLLRSDYMATPVSQQCHSYGIAFWIPYYGTGMIGEPYDLRSRMCAYNTVGWDMRDLGQNYDLVRTLVSQRCSIAKYYLGDYYPLTGYSLSENVWMAWQFDRPDLGEGIVQAFRRSGSSTASMTFKLTGLDSAATYTVDNFDTPGTATVTGSDLMNIGLQIDIPSQPGAVVISYSKD